MLASDTMNNFGLSALQKGMLFHHLLAPRSGVDIEQMIIELPEAVDADRLARAWNLVIARHEVLRAGFEWRGGHDARHVIDDNARIAIERLDLTAMSADEQDAATASYLATDRQRGFDLARPPLMRVTLAMLDRDRYRLVWTFHHILIDGRSFVIVLDQVWRAYEALAGDNVASIELEPSVPYRDYIDWVAKVDLSSAEVFWKEQLAGIDAPTPLPAEPARPAHKTGASYGELEIRLPAEVNARLAAFAREEQVTLNTLLQAAWALLLARHSGRDDVLFGSTKTTRSSSMPGIADAVGLFLVTVPMRVSVPDNMPVGEWLRGVRAAWVALRPYEQVPLADIGALGAVSRRRHRVVRLARHLRVVSV